MTLKRGAGLWARHRRGNVAAILALSLIPICGIVGMAIDFNAHRNAENHAQEALDMAALAAMKLYVADTTVADDVLLAEARAFFEDEVSDLSFGTLQDVRIASRNGGTTTFAVTGSVPTTTSRILGHANLPINVQSSVSFEIARELEMALVLDLSTSMNSTMGTTTRVAALRDAAAVLVDDLIDPTSDRIKMSIVPFSNNVKIDTGYRLSSWMDVEAERDENVGGSCVVDPIWAENNCPEVTYNCGADGAVQYCTKRSCAGVDGLADNQTCTGGYTQRLTWHGCVMSRPEPDYKSDDSMSYTASPIPGYVTPFADACADEIVELTNSDTALSTAITNLNPSGSTYIPTGLIWGLRTLSDHHPLNEGDDISTFISAGNTKALILMSDGKNTVSVYSNGMHDGSSQTEADALTSELCDLIKGEGIQIHTIAFGVSDATTKTMLESCATSTANYYDAGDADALLDAFRAIRDQFYTELAISG
jgi:Flp pilus assembly protein TadG